MKKILAVLLAMMLFAMPLSGLAADVGGFVLDNWMNGKEIIVDSGIEIAPGLLDDAIVDLLKIIGVRGHLYGMNAGAELVVSDNTAVTVEAGVGADAILAASNLLGDKAVAIGFDELEDIITAVADQVLAELGMTMDELIASVTEMMASFEALLSEENMALVDAYMNDVLNIVMEKAVETEDGTLRIVLEAADLRAIATNENLLALLASVAGEEVVAETKAGIENDLTDDCGLQLIIEVAETEESMQLFIQLAKGEEGIDVVVEETLAETSVITNVSVTGGNLNVPDWDIELAVSEDDTEMLLEGVIAANNGEEMGPLFYFDCNTQENLAVFSIYTSEEESIAVQYETAAIAENADEEVLTVLVATPEIGTMQADVFVDTQVDINSAISVVTLQLNGTPLATITTNYTAADDTGFFAPLENEAIHPLQMNEEELNVLIETVTNNAIGVLAGLIPTLPASVQGLLGLGE